MVRESTVESLRDTRLTEIACIGAGEGFSTYVGKFEGEPAFIVDSGTMADFLDEGAALRLVEVFVFESENAREAYMKGLPRACLGD